jgi:hypothetical protein
MPKQYIVVTLLVFAIACCVQTPGSAQQSAPAPTAPSKQPTPTQRVTSKAQIALGRWDVDRVLCSDLLGAADDDRAAALMFYYGYLAAKAGIRVIDVSQIDGNVKRSWTDAQRRTTSLFRRPFAKHSAVADDPPDCFG